jgi:hypothetical protein
MLDVHAVVANMAASQHAEGIATTTHAVQVRMAPHMSSTQIGREQNASIIPGDLLTLRVRTNRPEAAGLRAWVRLGKRLPAGGGAEQKQGSHCVLHASKHDHSYRSCNCGSGRLHRPTVLMALLSKLAMQAYSVRLTAADLNQR